MQCDNSVTYHCQITKHETGYYNNDNRTPLIQMKHTLFENKTTHADNHHYIITILHSEV